MMKFVYVRLGYVRRSQVVKRWPTVSGNSTGPHLHFELLRFGVPVDPTGYIRF
jgi:hypothetical protein